MNYKLPILLQQHSPSGTSETVRMYSYARKSKLDWSYQEIDTLFGMHAELGNRWTTISKYLPNKTENIIKNFFYSSLRKLIRKIKKSTIPSFDDKACLSFAHYQHLLEYLEDVLSSTSPKMSYRKKREVFILEMLKSQQLDLPAVSSYKENLIRYMAAEKQSWMSILSTHNTLLNTPELISIHHLIQDKFKELLNKYTPTNILYQEAPFPTEALH